MFGMGIGEVLLLGMIAVLLFGKRLPEVAHTLGQHYHRFRQGLTEIQYEMTRASSAMDRTISDARSNVLAYTEDDYQPPTAPEFSLPPTDTACDEPSTASQMVLPSPDSGNSAESRSPSSGG